MIQKRFCKPAKRSNPVNKDGSLSFTPKVRSFKPDGIKTGLAPSKWKRAMPLNAKIRPQEGTVIYFGSYDEEGNFIKRDRKDGDASESLQTLYEGTGHLTGKLSNEHFRIIINGEWQVIDGAPANEELVRRLCAKYNQSYRNAKAAKALDVAKVDYLFSLSHFNICGHCTKPIKTIKRKVLKSSEYGDMTIIKNGFVVRDNKIVEKDSFSASEVAFEYADIPAHHEFYLEHNKQGKVKMRYELIPNRRIFADKCTCPMAEKRKLERLDAEQREVDQQ